MTEEMKNWDEIKERLKLKITALNDNNFLPTKTKEEELLTRLEAKLGKSKLVILRIISGL